MKFLIVAIFLTLGFGYLGRADDFDLEKISTEEGKVYREILIVDSDEHGLLFRHQRGIAKIPFGSLPDNLRMLYEVTTPLEVPDEATEDELDPAASTSQGELVPLVFTVRTRVYPQAANQTYSHGCGPVSWPLHWPRFHPVHRLANPYCRELAVRDFLYTSGLLAKPPGVFTYRLPHYRPYLY